jgi:hypothetical protein
MVILILDKEAEIKCRLFSALDTTNIQVKKQVFELLSALCVYNAEGYNRAIEALEFYKVKLFSIKGTVSRELCFRFFFMNYLRPSP